MRAKVSESFPQEGEVEEPGNRTLSGVPSDTCP